jgi:enterochelin esterase-like enzyme
VSREGSEGEAATAQVMDLDEGETSLSTEAPVRPEAVIAAEAVAAAEAPAAPPEGPPEAVEWRPGRIHVLPGWPVPGLAPRAVRVYLPSTFTPQGPRFALYMFDGQNVFADETSFAGGWHLHEAVEKLARGRRLAPIVVGIDHGGAERGNELSPFPFAGSSGQLDLLLDWMGGTLSPWLGERLPLIGEPLGAVAGGSSMGGLAAIYAHFRHPELFGGALAMSPSLWVADAEILRWVAGRPAPEVSRIYLDCGAREGRGGLLPLVAALAAELQNRGYDQDHLMFRPDPRGAHNEKSWRRRLPKALRFFYR